MHTFMGRIFFMVLTALRKFVLLAFLSVLIFPQSVMIFC